MSRPERCPEGRWHVWKIVQRDEQPAPIDHFNGETELEGVIGPWLFERPVLVTYRCDKCGSEKVERV